MRCADTKMFTPCIVPISSSTDEGGKIGTTFSNSIRKIANTKYPPYISTRPQIVIARLGEKTTYLLQQYLQHLCPPSMMPFEEV